MRRELPGASAAVALLVAAFPLSAVAADLSGTWVMQPSGSRSHAGHKIEIEQKGSDFAFKRFVNMAGKETLSTDVRCSVGGGPCNVALDPLQKNSAVTRSEWKASAEGAKVVTELQSEWKADTPKTQQYIYSLSPDGKTMTVEYVYIQHWKNGPHVQIDNRGKGETYTRL